MAKDAWDRAEVVGKIAGALLVPAVLAIAGYYVQYGIKESDKRIKSIEIAIDILNEEPVPGEPSALREWAVEVLAASSEVPLGEKAKAELRTGSLPRAVGDETPFKYFLRESDYLLGSGDQNIQLRTIKRERNSVMVSVNGQVIEMKTGEWFRLPDNCVLQLLSLTDEVGQALFGYNCQLGTPSGPKITAGPPFRIKITRPKQGSQ